MTELRPEHIRISRAIETVNPRPALAGLRIDGDKVVATDGYLLAYCPLEKPSDTKYTIPAHMLKGLSNKTAKTLNAEEQDGQVTLASADGSEVRKGEAVIGTFPDWQSRVPEPHNEEPQQVAFSVSFLRRLLDVLEPEATGVKLYVNGRENPVRFEAVGSSVAGVIMPFFTNTWAEEVN